MARHTDISLKATDVEHHEISSPGLNLETGNHEFLVDSNLDRKVVIKLDLLLMPIMSVIFVFLFLDRANIGNARVAGMQKDLKLTDIQYQLGSYS